MNTVTGDISDEKKRVTNSWNGINETERNLINREIEEQFSKSLNGYKVEKGNYSHLNNIDPKELYSLQAKVRSELDKSGNFYLKGHYDLI